MSKKKVEENEWWESASPNEQGYYDRSYTSKDLEKIAGISYRMLNDWDSKGLLPSGCERKKGQWRSFDVSELLIILVMGEMRNQYGIKLESLKWLSEKMAKKGEDYFTMVTQVLIDAAPPVLLMTDFKTFWSISPPIPASDDFMNLFLDSENESENRSGVVIIKLNPLINQIFKLMNVPVQFKTNTEFYKLKTEFLKMRTVNKRAEFELLQIVRDGSYSKVEVHLKNGEIVQTKPVSKKKSRDIKEIESWLKNMEFGSLSLKMQDGKVVRVIEEGSIKYR